MWFESPLSFLLTSLSVFPAVHSSPAGAGTILPRQGSTFINQPVFIPPNDYTDHKVLYARSAQLADGSLIVTWDNQSPQPPLVWTPIFRSTDGGYTWVNYTTIRDSQNGWGLRYQAQPYVLPQQFGLFPAGSVLIAINSCPQDWSDFKIDLYASVDNARTFRFVSHIAPAGSDVPGAGPGNGVQLWEPFLMMYKNQLVCYYSDSRDPAHSQKLVHQTSSNGLLWSNPVDDVAYPDYNDRPGMTTVALIPSTGKYILTYEYCGAGGCQVYYKLSSNPLNFNSVPGVPLVAQDGTRPYSSPYVVHAKKANGQGVIIVSAASNDNFFVNDDSADPNGWTIASTGGAWAAYSRSTLVMNDRGKTRLLMAGGGTFWDPYPKISVGKIEMIG